MKLTGETEVLGEKTVPVPICPPQIQHGLTLQPTFTVQLILATFFILQKLFGVLGQNYSLILEMCR
jgi:hypothetical protein